MHKPHHRSRFCYPILKFTASNKFFVDVATKPAAPWIMAIKEVYIIGW